MTQSFLKKPGPPQKFWHFSPLPAIRRTMLTLERAGTIVDAALAKGTEMGARPLTVAVVDGHGHLKALKHQDGPGPMRSDIAIAKARAAIEGRDLGVPGGATFLDDSGDIIGAVGVSGHEELDDAVAFAGIAAVS